MSESFTIKDLSARTGLSVRTIRYYIAEGLVPPPQGRCGGATYEPRHLERLQLIRRLQDAHQPLATIRTQLEGLDDAEVRAALEQAPAPPSAPATGSARDYVAQVLGGMASGASPAIPSTKARAPERKGDKSLSRSHWERLILHADIELHIRRPLARAQQRRLDELIHQAKRLFDLDRSEMLDHISLI